ncbi:dihydrolipoamide acetyltransferase family protein [Rhizobium sp. EC-SD404]|uniref:dihydrolipoamide acetyltransferase family protein n=1 Tax=Rhizobium sp. EC-SD404 TaxID=2038389 RepID=UPI0012594959|nr:dihydrolipoamide acetyltransferase family protein [Rhizobium sp. EC-SD404]VVT00724.1 Lipoamide acyltransferase component of branched-chain alpha-keto acid dehydrogenase complex [Rhizobium sp. EC-SD404]
MGERTIKLPDVGEGVAEAELVEWHVKIGDVVREDDIVAAVMTDKATVEIPAPCDGEIAWLGAEVGDVVAVGSVIVRIKTGEGGADEDTAAQPMDDGENEAPIADGMSGEGEDLPPPPASEPQKVDTKPAKDIEAKEPAPKRPTRPAAAPSADKPLASPAVRLRARHAGIDLRQVAGSGPAGRITHDDLDQFSAKGPQAASPAGLTRRTDVEDIKLVGLRRKIAEKMAIAKRHIPHITYVEEVDMSALEDLRAALNRDKRPDQPKLTLLPFLMRAMVKAIAAQPQFNSHFDDEANIIHRHGGIHIGIAAQTPSGLVVPVAKHCEARDLWECAAEVGRLSDAAKSGTATREELSGSTITITSLGALGGIVTTPVINHPEVAIIGVNKMAVRPHWDGAAFVPRRMMNLSCSFDHRIIDGHDAAVFVQRIKTLMETPAMIFVA